MLPFVKIQGFILIFFLILEVPDKHFHSLMVVDICKRMSVRLHMHAALLATTKMLSLDQNYILYYKTFKLVRGGGFLWFLFLLLLACFFYKLPLKGDGVEAICTVAVHHLLGAAAPFIERMKIERMQEKNPSLSRN